MKTAVSAKTEPAQTSVGVSKASAQQSFSLSHSGRLAELAGMMNQGPRVQAQMKLAEEIQSGERVQAQFDLAGKINHAPAAQLWSMDEDDSTQRKIHPSDPAQLEEAPAPNRTGLPDQLKAGVENLSGVSLDDVKVQYNSAKPAQLNALAYAQGTDIHVAPGQEQHLPHEAWHIVQQKQGRVKPTMQMKGLPVNDDDGMEHEADAMGARAARHSDTTCSISGAISQPIQAKFTYFGKEFDKDNSGDIATKAKGLIKDGVTTLKALQALAESERDFEAISTAEEAAAKIAELQRAGAGEEKKDVNPEKQKKLQEYIDLLDHLAGELKEGKLTGGHLWTAVKGQFASARVTKGAENKENVWEAEWTDDPEAMPLRTKRSTFFPAKWTVKDLTQELLASNEVSGGRELVPSRILIQKAGDTFYPVLAAKAAAGKGRGKRT